MGIKRGALLLACLWSSFVFADGDSPKVYSPNPISRPLQKNIQLPGSWSDHIQILTKEPHKELLDSVLEILSPEHIRNLKGFQRWSDVRISLSTFELRSREVVDAVEALLEKGANVRIVVDGAAVNTFRAATAEEMKAWTQHQRDYYMRAYDRDADGEILQADIDSINKERTISRALWSRLQKLKEEHGKSLDLVSSPYEVVPTSDRNNYPRIHHVKAIWTQFRSNSRSAWKGPEEIFQGSSNFTDGSLSRKVMPTPANVRAYLNGEEFKYHPKSLGHIEFSGVVTNDSRDPDALAAVMGPMEDWIEAYKKGKHFDSKEVPTEQWPKLKFEDGATLQAFFSEGKKESKPETIDPLWVVTNILGREDIKLTAYFDSQFVYTHGPLARHLRTVLNKHLPKDFLVAVDSSQALESWSVLPDLTFAPVTHEMPGVFSGRAIEETPVLSEELDWANNVMIYRGGTDLIARDNDKLHTKVRYFEFEDSEGELYSVLIWGSSNSSRNSSKLAADMQYILTTKGPKLGRMVRPFFEMLRKNSRMEPYDQALIERWIVNNFHLTKKTSDPKLYAGLSEFLHTGKRPDRLRNFVSALKDAEPLPNSQGDPLLKLFEWQIKYRDDLKEFSWADLFFMIRITDGGRRFSEEYLSEIFSRWSSGIQDKRTLGAAKKSFEKIMNQFTEASPEVESGDKTRMALREHCLDWLKKVGGGEEIARTRHPVAEKRRTRGKSTR